MENKILSYLISLDPELMLGVFFFTLAIFIGLYKRFWIKHYEKSLKKMGLMDEDSRLIIRGLFLRFLTGKLKLIVKRPPPTDDKSFNREKLNSITPKNYVPYGQPRGTHRLELVFKKVRKIKVFILSKRFLKEGLICFGRVLDSSKLYFDKISHIIVSGITGSGKSVFFEFLTGVLKHQGYKVYFCSTISDEIEGAINIHLLDEPQLDRLITDLKELLSTIESDKKVQLKNFIIMDEFGDFASLAKAKEAKKEKELLALIVRIIRLGRKNSFFCAIGSQNILASELESSGLSRGMFPISIAFRVGNLKAFENVFGSQEPAQKLREPGVFYIKNAKGDAIHLQCPLRLKD